MKEDKRYIVDAVEIYLSRDNIKSFAYDSQCFKSLVDADDYILSLKDKFEDKECDYSISLYEVKPKIIREFNKKKK